MWGQLAIGGNCLSLSPFPSLKDTGRFGEKVELGSSSSRCSDPGDPQADTRTIGLRGLAREARVWEKPEEGRGLQGSMQGAWPRWGREGFPFLQEGGNVSAEAGRDAQGGAEERPDVRGEGSRHNPEGAAGV